MTSGGPGVPPIEFVEVHSALGGRWVLSGVSFSLPRDRITVLLGPSGVGKTTCIRHLLGLLPPPDEGAILIEGRPLAALKRREREQVARRFGVLLQSTADVYGSALWGSMTLHENLVHQLRSLRSGSEAEIEEVAWERLHEVGLADHGDRLPEEVSAGMRKRTALARALVADPVYAVLDDFDTGVDGVRAMGLCEIVRQRQARVGGTYLITTHDMEVAARLADQIVVMLDGRILDAGPAERVLASEDAAIRQLLDRRSHGPIVLADASRPARGTPTPAPRPDVAPYDIPIWLAGLAVLVVITASVIWLSARQPWELVLLALAWLASGAAYAARRPAG